MKRLWRQLWLAVTVVSGSLVAQSGPARQPVLNQIRLPHGYYYREMFVPQVTGGPTAAAWSPDGDELVYAMQGSLWRQRLDAGEAIQLTAGDGYDHQPDWSPDGRFIVYASYRNDAIELWLLDATSGATRPVLADGAVNVEPRWSPDGSRIAFVSTAHEGRWHVFVAPFQDGRFGPPERITEDRDSGLPRYYYSRWDHYLSPTWSPDGRELIVVSNRGRIWGTGGFWRLDAAPGAAPREVHYEETTWKARPDWSRDGKRVVYSGYQGRQWHQLWLVPAGGGDPFQLTYGEFDATAPRWSPDASRIAFISNEDGNTSLVVLDVPGGRRRRVTPLTRRYRAAVGTLEIRVTDRAGNAMPARVAVSDSSGRSFAPDEAWRHADEAFVRGERKFEYGYFHTDGTATLTVPTGRYSIQATRGPEYAIGTEAVTIDEDAHQTVRVVLDRLADLPARGWWSGDLHVHMNYGGAYRNTPEHLKFQALAEGLHLVENLVVNKEQRIPDIGYFRTTPDPVSDAEFLLLHGEEFHTSFWGHTALLGLKEYFLLPNYAAYVNTAAASLVPTNSQIFDLAHAQGALTGYVHPFDTRPDPQNRDEPLLYALPVDVALGKLDYLEVMGFSDHLITSDIWYRLLNCGFRLPAAAGTDAFPNFASLRGPAGLVRVFVRIGATLDPERFLEGLRRGRTFVTNAPLLEFEIDAPVGALISEAGTGRTPDPREAVVTPATASAPRNQSPTGEGSSNRRAEIGDEIHLAAGRHVLRARVAVRSHVPIDRVEVVRNSAIVVSVPLGANRMEAVAEVPLETEESGWYVLRAYSQHPRLPVLDLYPFASTSPIYVTLADRPVRSEADAKFFLAWIDRLRGEVEAYRDWNTSTERETTLAMLVSARAEFERRARRP